jgi:hypothetical protein
MSRTAATFDLQAEIRARTVEIGDCLEWIGRFGSNKNRSTPLLDVAIDGVRHYMIVSREVWKARHGPIPAGRVVYRSCLNYRCVTHLALGRSGSPPKARAEAGIASHPPSAVAAMTKSKRKGAKYSAEQVAALRSLLADGHSAAEAGRMVGIAEDMARDIRSGRRWRAAVGSVWAWGLAA